MRIGKVEKPRRGEKNPPRADAKGKPKHAAAASVVGKLSPDIISTYFAPELTERASSALEEYAEALLEYDEIMRDYEQRTEEAEINADGTVQNTSELPKAPLPPLYQSEFLIKELNEVLKDTSNHFHSKKGPWKIHVRAAKFERLMDEKYGIFRPYLKAHPEMERFLRSMQVKYANGNFSPFRQGKSPIPKSTAVIILFMMKRGDVRWEILTLATLFFLVGLQPWALVVLVAGAHTVMEGRRKRTLKPMKKYIPTVEPYYDTGDENSSKEEQKQKKNDILCKPVGTPLKPNVDFSQYDTMILGAGPDALYTAALLSRAGRKVAVITSKADASGCYTIDTSNEGVLKKFKGVPFDVGNSNVSKIGGQQELLAPALSTTTDCQGGIRFAKIGSEADGFAFEILSVPGMGSDSVIGAQIPFVLRGNGISSLVEDAALYLGDGWPGIDGSITNSQTGIYAQTCESINADSAKFYASKMIPENVNEKQGKGSYQSAAIRYASSFLDKGFPTNAHLRSLFSAIGMKGENIKPSMTSFAAHITNVGAALSGEGMHYPIGGPRALCHAFAAVIEQSGGSVFTNVPVAELIFDEEQSGQPTGTDSSPPPPRCVGVKLLDKRELKFDINSTECSPAVISMHGFISTFIRLLSEDIRMKYKVPRGLPALTESRPVFKALFALHGSSRDLNITGADYYRVPGAALAQDEVDPVTGEVRLGEIGWVDEAQEEEIDVEDVNEGNPQGPGSSTSSRGKRDKKSTILLPKATKKKKVKYETDVSWMQISFPSAKDPSFESRHGKVTTCVVTVEADDDFVTAWDTKPKIYGSHKFNGELSGDHLRLMERIKRDLLHVYPQLEGKIVYSQLVGPINRGLSHGPERFAALGIRPETPYPGLYVGGSDLTVGDSFSGSIVGGWLAANAVMGYSAIDHLYLQKNITSDIIRFLEEPDVLEEEDLAVPYVPTKDD